MSATTSLFFSGGMKDENFSRLSLGKFYAFVCDVSKFLLHFIFRKTFDNRFVFESLCSTALLPMVDKRAHFLSEIKQLRKEDTVRSCVDIPGGAIESVVGCW
jgi:cell shape-determining protein MreD